MEKKEFPSATVASQLKSLMEQADLTIEGLSEAAGLTTHTLTKILKQQTRISKLSLAKLSALFGVSPAAFTSTEPIELKNLPYRGTLDAFYRNNEANPTYFQSRAKENVVAHFIKHVLIYDPFLDEGRRVREIAEYVRTNPRYQKDFNRKVIAKVLDRMVRTGSLIKKDKTGKGAVYYYSRRIYEQKDLL